MSAFDPKRTWCWGQIPGEEMDYNAFKSLVLAAIAEHDGVWTWYQLDRYLSATIPEMMGSLMPALRDLEQDGCIRLVGAEANPGMPRYAVASAER